LLITGSIIPPTERNLSVLELEDSVIADGYPVGVSAQVLQDPLGSIKGRLAIDDPLLVVELPPEDLEGTRPFEMGYASREDQIPCLKAVFELIEELASEQRGHHPEGMKESLAARHPAATIRRQTSSGDDAVNMWMVHEVLSPGMENRYEADPCAEVLWIVGELHKSLRGRAEQEIVHDLLIHDAERIELRGDGKDHVEVLNGQEIFASVLDPFFFAQGLALGAVPVPAGVGRIFRCDRSRRTSPYVRPGLPSCTPRRHA